MKEKIRFLFIVLSLPIIALPITGVQGTKATAEEITNREGKVAENRG